MKVLISHGPRDVRVQNVADAELEPTDALLKITSPNICGSDPHMSESRTNVEEENILGHENLGQVVEVGSAVAGIKVGDWVCLPINIACGFCKNWERGFTGACVFMNPGSAGAPLSGARKVFDS